MSWDDDVPFLHNSYEFMYPLLTLQSETFEQPSQRPYEPLQSQEVAKWSSSDTRAILYGLKAYLNAHGSAGPLPPDFKDWSTVYPYVQWGEGNQPPSEKDMTKKLQRIRTLYKTGGSLASQWRVLILNLNLFAKPTEFNILAPTSSTLSLLASSRETIHAQPTLSTIVSELPPTTPVNLVSLSSNPFTESNLYNIDEDDALLQKRPDMKGAEQRSVAQNTLHEVQQILAMHHKKQEALAEARRDKTKYELSLSACQQKILAAESSLANLRQEIKLVEKSVEEATSKVASLESEQLTLQRQHEESLAILKEEDDDC